MMEGFYAVISVSGLSRIQIEKDYDDNDKINNVKIISRKCAEICTPPSTVSKIMQKHYIMFYNCASYFKLVILYMENKGHIPS